LLSAVAIIVAAMFWDPSKYQYLTLLISTQQQRLFLEGNAR
jgi:hypothetical protein